MVTVSRTTTCRGAFTRASGVVHVAKFVHSVGGRSPRETCSRCGELTAAREKTCRLRSARSRPSPEGSTAYCPAFLVSRPRRALDRRWGIAWSILPRYELML